MGNFEIDSIAALAAKPPDALVLYSVAWDPIGLLRNKLIVDFLHRNYGYRPQVTSEQIVDLLHMHSISRWTERGQWIEVFEGDGIRPHTLRAAREAPTRK
jgi:hypothetical protein